jgi:hypothetical protein
MYLLCSSGNAASLCMYTVPEGTGSPTRRRRSAAASPPIWMDGQPLAMTGADQKLCIGRACLSPRTSTPARSTTFP